MSIWPESINRVMYSFSSPTGASRRLVSRTSDSTANCAFSASNSRVFFCALHIDMPWTRIIPTRINVPKPNTSAVVSEDFMRPRFVRPAVGGRSSCIMPEP